MRPNTALSSYSLLFTLLLVTLFVFPRVIATKPPMGYRVELPPLDVNEFLRRFGDDRLIVVGIDATRVRINLEKVQENQLGSALNEILAPRVGKYVFIRADRELEYQRVINIVDTIRDAVPEAEIELITPRAEESYRPNPNCRGPVCK